MTINEYNQYKNLSNKILDLLIEEKRSSLADIKIIYNIIMGFPYCLCEEGQYTYHGKFYNSLEELPIDAKEEIINIYSTHTLSHNDENIDGEESYYL